MACISKEPYAPQSVDGNADSQHPFPTCWIRIFTSTRSSGHSLAQRSSRSPDWVSISLCFARAHCSGLNHRLHNFLMLDQFLTTVRSFWLWPIEKKLISYQDVEYKCVYINETKMSQMSKYLCQSIPKHPVFLDFTFCMCGGMGVRVVGKLKINYAYEGHTRRLI